MEPVPVVGRGFFPLDEQLALPAGSSLTPRQQEHLVHLSSWMPFERAASMLHCLLGVQVSEATTRRQSEQAGALALAVQTQQAKAPSEDPPKPEARLAVSADGAYVPLLKGAWAHLRPGAIGEVAAEGQSQGEPEVHVHQLSYFSRMSDAETFADLAEVEMGRRGVSQAQEVAAVTDGAEWLQGLLDLHCPDAVRILDFAHAAEHLSALLQALQQAGMKLPTDLLPRLVHRLKHRGPALLLYLLARLPSHLQEQDGIREHVGYFRKRAALMQYPQYREQGWPIGSGMVESANKLVVEARLKGAGMHWQENHVNPMLTLRNAVCNERWQESWQQITSEKQRQRLLQRQERATTRWQQRVGSLLLLLLRLRPAVPKPAATSSPALKSRATLPGSSRPSPAHPWKKALVCRPKPLAKN